MAKEFQLFLLNLPSMWLTSTCAISKILKRYENITEKNMDRWINCILCKFCYEENIILRKISNESTGKKRRKRKEKLSKKRSK